MKEQTFVVDELLRKYVVGERVLELGAGIFRFFGHYTAETKVGIELIRAYVDQRRCGQNVIALQGDICEFEKVLDAEGIENKWDVIVLCDIVEHLEKSTALSIIQRAQQVAKSVVVFTPYGFEEQHGHEHVDFGVGVQLGDERAAAINAQRHVSEWWPGDLERLGFNVLVHKNYHGPGRGAMWARWA